jgi:hypothetical protein
MTLHFLTSSHVLQTLRRLRISIRFSCKPSNPSSESSTRAEAEIEQQATLPPPLPTRSHSVAEGLTLSPIPVLPPVAPQFERGATSPQNAAPGTFTAVFRNSDAPATFCRILCKKPINDTNHLLIVFFSLR